ncbi:MAG: hypothetical protein JW838_04640 [Spirochaetes bacterium]|nr:hypothetical protein [Spirochaetota bacterium]
MKKYCMVMSLIITAVFVVSLASAQETKDDGITKMPDGSYRSKDHDESNRPEDSYLAKFHAMDVVDRLIKRNLDEIYLLRVITANNSGKGDWEAKYKEIYEGYKDGLQQYYKRNLVYARDKLQKNQVAIRELFKIIIADYQKQCEELLNECAGKVLLLHLDVSSRIDPDRFDLVNKNHLRLKVGYGQLDEAQSATIASYYPGAISHLRMSRTYGIAILEDLAKDENEKKAVHDKYKIQKADNLNRIYQQQQ